MAKSLKTKKLFTVIAAYNEEKQIEQTIKGLRENNIRNIVVIDDGSRDKTPEIAKKSGAILIKHPINLGQGAALQTGLDFAVEHGADLILTFDADGQHDPTNIQGAVTTLMKCNCDVLLGSRFKGKSLNMPFLKRLTLFFAILYTRITTGNKFTDAHNGFRIFTKNAVGRFRIQQNRMAHASEILEKITKLKLRYIEFPVTIRYTKYSIAKGQKITNSINILKDLFMRGLYS